MHAEQHAAWLEELLTSFQHDCAWYRKELSWTEAELAWYQFKYEGKLPH